MTTRKVIFHRDGTNSYFVDGEPCDKAAYDKARPKRSGVPGITKAYNRPLVSKSLGIHPDEVAAKNRELAAIGETGVRFLPNGNAEFSSRAARRREMKRSGLVDQDGGYGDG